MSEQIGANSKSNPKAKIFQTEEIGVYSKSELEAVISGYARKNNARMIFWHHRVQSFMFLLARDKDQYKEMMNKVRDQLADGSVIKVTAGETLTIDGIELFPIEVEYRGVQCGPYFLLTKRCMLADLDKTPYFFRTAEKRDNAISYITRE